MKISLITLLMIVFAVSIYSQEYVEITNYGWGPGINGSKPAFVDLNNNGLLDMIVGDFNGNLHHYEQSTANSVEFQLITDSFNSIDVVWDSAPTFADIDNDGLLDMIIGDGYGNLHHYEQSTVSSIEFQLITHSFNYIDVEWDSTPTFADIDNDGLLDLIIGEGNGNLHHYEQSTINSLEFQLITNSFNYIVVGGNSAPSFVDIDNDGLLDLIIGDFYGNLHHYEQSAANSVEFQLITDSFNSIDVGGNSAPKFVDLDNNGFLDLIVGKDIGSFNHYEQSVVNSEEFQLITNSFNSIDVGDNSAPTFVDLDNNGLLDLIVGKSNGILYRYEQSAVNSDKFQLSTHSLNPINVGNHPTPIFVDLDDDELLDLIIGECNGKLNHYEQSAINSLEFQLITDSFNSIDVGWNSTPAFADIDSDGLLDLIIGESNGKLNHYEQSVVNSLEFQLVTDSFNSIDIGGNSAPTFVDLDNNGLLDLIVGEGDGNLNHYEQSAVNSEEFQIINENFAANVDGFSKPFFTDINGDGLEDLLVGEIDGGIQYFQRVNNNGVGENINIPISSSLISNYPNPFNPSTTIEFNMQENGLLKIEIYNVKGQKIKTLVNKEMFVGRHSVVWNSEDKNNNHLCSGVYFIKMQALDYQEVKMMLLLK